MYSLPHTYTLLRHIFLCSLLACIANGYAQTTTTWRPANLEIDDYIKHINVSPDGTIWLLNAERGNAVYLRHGDSIWHYGPSWKSAEDDHHLIFGPTPEMMVFADSNTAIVGGSIHTGQRDEGAILRTTDGGKSWQTVPAGLFSTCGNLCTVAEGAVWLSASRELYYSANKGQTWERLPFAPMSYPVSCLTMLNREQGIAGTSDGQLVATTNNWQSVSVVTPPVTEKATGPVPHYDDNKIQQLYYWQGKIVVQQKDKWYTTDTNSRQWQPITGNITIATTGHNQQILYAIDSARYIWKYTTPANSSLFCPQPLPAQPQHVQYHNGQLYILTTDMRVWMANEKEITPIPLYTTDRPMTLPEPIYKGSHVSWGTNGRQVLANTGNGWYRIKTVPFRVGTIVPDTGSTALLWGGGDEQYVADAITGNIRTYNPQKPLQSFLRGTITSVTISSITSGCFSTEATSISYQQKKDTLLVATEIERNTNAMQQKDTCWLSISPAEWHRVLAAINAYPQYRPSMKDFGITDMDRVAYTETTDRLTYHMNDDNTALMTLAEWNTAMPAVDTIGAGLLHQIINRSGVVTSTSNTNLSVTITNSEGDTLYLRHGYSVSPSPWLLPFYLFYKGHLVACYHPALAKCIADALPDNFPGKSACHNYVLMMAAARQIMGKNE